jgi:hypothetical protein
MTGDDRVGVSWETLQRILRFFAPDRLIEDFLLSAEDLETWSFLREMILLLKSKVPPGEDFRPLLEAYDRLYLLFRFVEIYERFPNQWEQVHLFESLEESSMATLNSLLRSKMSSTRERLLRRLDRKRKLRRYRGVKSD